MRHRIESNNNKWWLLFAVQVVKIVLENEELRVQVQQLEDDRATASKSWAETIEEKVQFETALLQQRIKELNHSNDSNVAEKNAIDEDRRDLESRLELLRTEFDRLDDYWQVKHPLFLLLSTILISKKVIKLYEKL